MCGIVGAIARRDVVPVLIEGLKRLEYRGYDSAGVAVVDGKDDGKLHSTELRIFSEKMRGGGDGQRPMNDARNQTMTNATVMGTAIVNGSNVMKEIGRAHV